MRAAWALRRHRARAAPRAARAAHPGSLNLPYDRLFADGGTLLRPDAAPRRLPAGGRRPGRPVVDHLRLGRHASVLALGLHLLGRRDAAVYDGSWTEWGGRPDTPVAP